MPEKLRISSPVVFEKCLSNSGVAAKHDWLFDNNPSIVMGFRPHITICFEASEMPLSGHFGYSKAVSRYLVCQGQAFLVSQLPNAHGLEEKTFITITHDDDEFLKVYDENNLDVEYSPATVFRANDAQAAEMAVQHNIGFCALPGFMITGKENIVRVPKLKVCPTYLRIQSRADVGPEVSTLHERLLHIMPSELGSSWEAFGHICNVVSMDGA